MVTLSYILLLLFSIFTVTGFLSYLSTCSHGEDNKKFSKQRQDYINLSVILMSICGTLCILCWSNS